MSSSVLHGYPAKCPVCDREFRAAEATEILSDPRAGAIVHFTCEDCRSSLIFSLRMEGPGMIGMGMLTDLAREEARDVLVGSEPVSDDDVLAAYRAFRTRKGLGKLLEK